MSSKQAIPFGHKSIEEIIPASCYSTRRKPIPNEFNGFELRLVETLN